MPPHAARPAPLEAAHGIVTSGIGLRAGRILLILKKAMPEAEVAGFYDPQPTHLAMIGEGTPRYPTLEVMLSDAKAASSRRPRWRSSCASSTPASARWRSPAATTLMRPHTSWK